MSPSFLSFQPKTSFSHCNNDTSKFLSFFETYLSDIIDCLDEPIRELARHVSLNGGKRIRPMLVYICGNNNGSSTDSLLKASAVIELVHIATLVHDDILDCASLRRGKPTIHKQYGRHTSILLGDALFSFALELATDFPTTTVCRFVSSATRKTCSGEIRQNFSIGNFSLSIEDYYSVIQDKTGELFNASCSVGAFLGGHNTNLTDVLGDFGTSLGLNYQIYDDLVDTFGHDISFGKTLGTDFDSGKVTLPLIMLLNLLPLDEKNSLIFSLKNTSKDINFLVHLNKLFDEYSIHEACYCELNKRLSDSKLIASNIPCSNLSANLIAFIDSFNTKLELIAKHSKPNFLAQI